jgi:hypothetical protein
MTIWSILWPLEIFYSHMVYFAVIWYIFPRFGILDQAKSVNPVAYYYAGAVAVNLKVRLGPG